MTAEHTLHLTIHGETRTLTIAGDTPAQLAAAVHRHARGQLGGSRVDIHLDDENLTGNVISHGTEVGSFTLTATPHNGQEDDTPDTSAPDHIAHGYTVRDLNRLARAACAADRTLSSDMTTRYDIAWSAIAEALWDAEQPPSRDQLVRVGWQAIYQDVKAVRRLYGVDSTGRSGEVASAPRFVAYWTHITTDAASEGITERVALYQVLATLRDDHRRAIVALATQDDYQKAADALGLKYATLVAHVRFGRQEFRRYWFAPDTAPPVKGTDRRVGSRNAALSDRCAAGHLWTPENTRWSRGRTTASAKVRRCRACERDRSRARREAAA